MTELIRRTWCQQEREPYDWQEEAGFVDDIAQGNRHVHVTHITLQKLDNKQRPELLLSNQYQAGIRSPIFAIFG